MKVSTKARRRGIVLKIRNFLRARKIATYSDSSLFHSESLLDASPAAATSIANSLVEDKELINRIIVAYQGANQTDLGKSMWNLFFTTYHQPVHQALIDGNEKTVTEILRKPEISDLFYGFDMLTKSYQHSFRNKKVQKAYAKACLDGLVRFAESVGAVSMDNPESELEHRSLWKTEKVLAELDKLLISGFLRILVTIFSFPSISA